MKLWAALGAALVPGGAEAACRLALILALDVSGSVDADEYELQLQGVAAALNDPGVRAALFAMPEAPVALAAFEFSSSEYQRIVQDWVLIEDAASLDAVTDRLTGWSREAAPEATALGAAMAFAARRFDDAPVCWSRTLDISADGKNNDWPAPERLRADGVFAEMTINALVIASDFLVTYDTSRTGVAEMAAYFEHRIIQGPGAFVEVALGYEDYARAMTRKLLRELAAQPLGQAPLSPTTRYVSLP